MPENLCFSFGLIQSQIPGDHVSARVGKLDVRDARDDLGEERSVGWILRLLKHLGVAITESRLKQNMIAACSVEVQTAANVPVSCHTVLWFPCWSCTRKDCIPSGETLKL